MATMPRPTTQRFWEKIKIQENGCWLWVGAVDTSGYGMMRVDADFGGTSQRAHRVAYLAFRGEIPEGMCVLHHCDTPRCVHPDHLFCGFQSANVRDMREKQRADHFGHKKRDGLRSAGKAAASAA